MEICSRDKHMGLPALKFEAEVDVDSPSARLESDVEHIKNDVKDIKAAQLAMAAEHRADVRRLDDKIDSVKDSVNTLRIETKDSIGALRVELHSAKLWAIGLYLALAGALLFAMARGFKWL